jgi:alkanesulfonate monooxygenase SsuD/methylene tetrahydromethanopterin reductase-like flavin-dependent oxidoreductase (luciferase family)
MVGTLQERGLGFADIKAAAARAGRDPESLWLVGRVDMSIDPARQQASRHVAAEKWVQRVAAPSNEQVVQAVLEERRMGAYLTNLGFAWDFQDDLIRRLEEFATDVVPQIRRAEASEVH